MSPALYLWLPSSLTSALGLDPVYEGSKDPRFLWQSYQTSWLGPGSGRGEEGALVLMWRGHVEKRIYKWPWKGTGP